MRNFINYGIDTHGRTGGKIRSVCPKCKDSRGNPGDKSLSVDLDTGWCHCFHCEAHFRVPDEKYTPSVKPADTPPPVFVEANLNLPAVVADYFAARGIQSDTLRAMRVTAQYESVYVRRGERHIPSVEQCIAFNYFERDRLVNVKFRTLNKEFKLVKGAELIPYNIDAIAGRDICYVVEGEIDALSLHQVGRTEVVSVPSGANANLTWMERFVDSHFADKRLIFLATDMDECGRRLRTALLERLGATRCRIVTFSPDCKDANEELVKHGPDSLLRCLDAAREPGLEEVVCAADMRGDLLHLMEHGLARGKETGLENLDALCTFETGRLMVVTGRPGDGKSEFVDELVTRLCLRHDWHALYFSPENTPLALHQCKLIERLAGRKFRRDGVMDDRYLDSIIGWLSSHVAHIRSGNRPYTPENVLDIARVSVARHGTRILVIDPLNRLEQRLQAGQTELQYISNLLNSLTRFAEQQNCLVILVAHPRKVNRTADGQLRRVEMNDINGSADFGNKCDYCLVVERDHARNLARVHVDKVRFKHLGHTGTCSFLYNVENGRFQPCRESGGAVSLSLFDVKYQEGGWIPLQPAAGEPSTVTSTL